MSEVLSQNEIDRLLSGVHSGEIKEEELNTHKKEVDIYEYDFRRPTRISKDQLKTIRTLHETFAEIFGFFLASRLQTMTGVELVSVDQLRYSEYTLSIANPSCIYMFDIAETEGRCVLEMPPELVYSIVERLLGGQGNTRKKTRGITAIEQRLIKPIVLQALSDLSAAWKPVQQLSFHLEGFESNADFLQIAPATEIVIVISFQIKIGEDTFILNICYPSFALEDIIVRLNTQLFSAGLPQKDKGPSRQRITDHLYQTQMQVRAVLGKTSISLKDLLELESGDIICLENKIDEEISILVDDRLKFLGRPGIVDGFVSVKITRELEENIRTRSQAHDK